MSSSDQDFDADEFSSRSFDTEDINAENDAIKRHANKPFSSRDLLLGIQALNFSFHPPLHEEIESTSQEQDACETGYLSKTQGRLLIPGHYQVTSIILDRLIMHGLPSFLCVFMLLGIDPKSTGSTK